MTHDEWLAEGERRFGKDKLTWRFVCPVCKHIASVQDWKDAKAPESVVAFSCVGRWQGQRKEAFEPRDASKGGPCNYAGGGLFRLNPVEVTGIGEDGEPFTVHLFAFADRVPA